VCVPQQERIVLNTVSSPQFLFRFIPMLVLMAITRVHHLGSALHLPDASWAMFFLAGYYLGRPGFWAMMIAAVALDWLAFAAGGSDYCLSPAYLALLPAYAALWYGGRVLQRGAADSWRFALRALTCWWLAASCAYLLSNGSFYWFSGRIADPSWSGYWPRAAFWYGRFVSVPVMYLIAAALVHACAGPLLRWRAVAR
jgi:hypothetical protein